MTVVTDLLDAVKQAAHRFCGPYGPCFCRPPQPSPELGHERACQNLRMAIRAVEAESTEQPS